MLKLSIKIVLLVLLPLKPMTVGAEGIWVEKELDTISYPIIIDGRYEINEHWEPILDDPDYIIAGYKVIYDTTDLWLENGIDTIECWWEPKVIGWWCLASVFDCKELEMCDSVLVYAHPPDSVLVCDTTWIDTIASILPCSIWVDMVNEKKWDENKIWEKIKNRGRNKVQTRIEKLLSVYGPQRPLKIYDPILEFDEDDNIILIIKYKRQGDTGISVDTIPPPNFPNKFWYPSMIRRMLNLWKAWDLIEARHIFRPGELERFLAIDTTWREETSFYINPDRYWFLNRFNSRRTDSSKIMHPEAVIVDKLLPDEYEIDSTDVTDWDERGNPKIWEE